jgi:hypothetical protein
MYANVLVGPLGDATLVADHFHAIRLANPINRYSIVASGHDVKVREGEAGIRVTTASLPGRRAAGGRPQGRP